MLRERKVKGIIRGAWSVGTILHRMDRAGCAEVTSGKGLSLSCLREVIFSRGNSKCKDPEAGTCLVCSGETMETSVVGTMQARQG